MMVLPFMGYILALLTSGLAYVFWRKILVFQTSLSKALDENYRLAESERVLNKSLNQAEGLKKDFETKVLRLEKDYQGAVEQMKKAQEEVEKSVLGWQLKMTKTQNELDKYKEESRAMTVQLVEIDQEKRKIKKELAHKDDHIQKMLSEEKDKILKEEREKRKTLEEKIKALESQKATIDSLNAEEAKLFKKKARDYFYFYKTARLQKEMMEERNANWETALKSLAYWVYEKENPQNQPPTVLGELVSGALKLAKQPQLVQDDEYS